MVDISFADDEFDEDENVEFLDAAPQRVRRRRSRRDAMKIDKQNIYDRVVRFYHDDLDGDSEGRDRRIQRYAKYRMWTEGKDWPWPDASDIPLPDMMEKSSRIQDTLHNAVMSQRPVVGAKATAKGDPERAAMIDHLQDHQFFVENRGEHLVGEVGEKFANEPAAVVFIPWVEERREISEVRVTDPIPDDLLPEEYFERILVLEHPGRQAMQARTGAGWDWVLTGGDEPDVHVRFYTRRGGQVEMVLERTVTVFDGPKIIVCDYDDILTPPRAANLDPPGPSNPGGATHVIKRDFPTVNEVKRLAREGFYDMLDNDDIDRLETLARSGVDEEKEDQKDAMEGREDEQRPHDRGHGTLTRLMCFDTFDIDGDGIAEDVIWWVILELNGAVCRARKLTEVYPGPRPYRPFAEASFLPVAGRRAGISLLEQIEGIHDAMKMSYDQMIDYGTITNAPFWFYRPGGGVKPEVIRLAPGEGYPLNDAQRDVNFPNWNSNAQAFHLNNITLLNQMEERQTLIGDLQAGRVPGGRSSALRTTGNMALLMGQGEARPERILRRFFQLFARTWQIMHWLNQAYLPDGKRIRLGARGEEQATISPDTVAGEYLFEFQANAVNTSKQALQQALQQLLGVLLSPLTFQMGVVNPEKAYRLLADYTMSLGVDPEDYLVPPSPEASMMRITANEAFTMIARGEMPNGVPAEPGGWVEHIQALQAIGKSDQFGILDSQRVMLYGQYLQLALIKAQEEQQQQQLLQAAAQFSQQAGGPGDQGGRPPENPPQAPDNAPVQGGELLDETLPGAGGGGAQ